METLSSRCVSHFELRGTHAAEMAVAPCFIVEVINIVGHSGDRQFAVLVDLFLNPLLFRLLKNDSTKALSQQFPLRLMLGSR